MKRVCCCVLFCIAPFAWAEQSPLTVTTPVNKHNNTVAQVEIIRDQVAPTFNYGYDFSYLNAFNSKTSITSNLTKTGLYVGTERDSLGQQRFIQGSYTLLSNNTVNIAITAKLSTLEPVIVLSPENLSFNMEQQYGLSYEEATNTTFGIVGKYQLTNNWAIVGSLSTTSLSQEVMEKAALQEELAHSALIGATYSF